MPINEVIAASAPQSQTAAEEIRVRFFTRVAKPNRRTKVPRLHKNSFLVGRAFCAFSNH
jgi:hypothetical protein